MRDSKYPQGYLPKIAYWAGQLQRAAAAGDLENTYYIKSKLDYFLEKQKCLTEVAEGMPHSLTTRQLTILRRLELIK